MASDLFYCAICLTNGTEKVLSPCFEFVSFKNEIYEPTMLNILEQ